MVTGISPSTVLMYQYRIVFQTQGHPIALYFQCCEVVDLGVDILCGGSGRGKEAVIVIILCKFAKGVHSVLGCGSVKGVILVLEVFQVGNGGGVGGWGGGWAKKRSERVVGDLVVFTSKLSVKLAAAAERSGAVQST